VVEGIISAKQKKSQKAAPKIAIAPQEGTPKQAKSQK
jgi:hypothetical protein